MGISVTALVLIMQYVGWQEDGLVWKEGKGSLLKKRKKKASRAFPVCDASMMRRARH